MRDVLRRETRKAFGFGFCCGRDAWSAETFAHSIESAAHHQPLQSTINGPHYVQAVSACFNPRFPTCVGADSVRDRSASHQSVREQARSYRISIGALFVGASLLANLPQHQPTRQIDQGPTHHNVTEAHHQRARIALSVTVPPRSRTLSPRPFSHIPRSISVNRRQFVRLGTASAYLHAWIIGSKNPRGNTPCAWYLLPARR